MFLCNYSQSAEEIELELRSFGDLKCSEFTVMESNDLTLSNTFARPDAVKPESREPVAVSGEGKAGFRVAPMSWNFLKFTY